MGRELVGLAEFIDMHRDCTFAEFKTAHRDACAAMDRYVADAIGRDSMVPELEMGTGR